ncbi:MAG: hypothetical protein WBD41_08565, partial [Rhodococcus sp. (in: high G+C Gram-positive bacteria)]
RKETFPVVRGTGQLNDVKLGLLGDGFHDLADHIMDDTVLAKNRMQRVMLVPTNFYDLKRLGALEIFDPITILFKNESHVCFIRKMEWTVHENHVRLALFFNRESKGVVWLPQMQTADVVSEIVYETV